MSQNVTISPEKLKKYSKHFHLNVAPRPHFFEKIYKFRVEECDSDFPIDDFFKHLYTVNDSIEKCYNEIVENIRKHRQFHILHSYGQNGKSTFLRYLEYRINENKKETLNLNLMFFDFSKSYKFSFHEYADTYYNRCCYFFEQNIVQLVIIDENKFLTEINEFVKFINEVRYKLLTSDGVIQDFFGEYIDNFKEIIELIFVQNRANLTSAGKLNKFKEQIRDFLKKNEAVISPSDLFCFILFLKLFQNRLYFINNQGEYNNDSKPDKRSKLLFILDNIDDIKNHLAETIATHQTDFLTEYFVKLSNIIQPIIIKYIPGLFLETDVSFIFSYRTANYINSVHAYKHHLNQSSIERYAHVFINAAKYKISTVKSSFEIIQKRLSFYNTLCNSLNRIKDDNYYLMTTLLSTVSPDLSDFDDDLVIEDVPNEINDIKNIFRLWNGNRKALFDIVEYSQTKLLFELSQKIPTDYSYLRKGSFIYLSLFVLHNRRFHTQLGRMVDYLFTMHIDNIENIRASLFRLMLTYVICINDSSDNRKITKTEDIITKGVSLANVLKKLTEFKDINNQTIYKKEDFIRLFDNLFFEEIDEWGHLLSCYKGTIFYTDNGKEKVGKKFQFRNDIELFFKEFDFEKRGFVNPITEKYLESIRLYYNDNSKYLITHVIMHFEFYSFSIDSNKPLIMLNYNIVKNGEIDFAFNDVINKVYKRVEACINSNVNFYLNSITKIYPNHQFVISSNLCLNNKFFFADMIAKHVTYIEQFRQCVINEDINNPSIITDSEDTKFSLLVLANSKLTNIIHNYINLFFTSYSKIESDNNKIPISLERTKNGFRILQRKTQAIINSDYKDFKTKISTNENIRQQPIV